MKYGIWSIRRTDRTVTEAMIQAGFSPLTAKILSSRGYESPEKAKEFLSADAELTDPLCMKDMAKAAERVRMALRRREKIAVFGDYDVDGITATCLLTEFLRSQGGDVLCYIPARIEEGYGLNITAISELKEQGVSLIVSVDCGITAQEEAQFCMENNVDLIITDHHECKNELPCALAVVNPHRPDDTYPHQNLAGVGVAFKLASAVVDDQQIILERFSDLLCLGTVADVMPLVGENRTFVLHGLKALSQSPRPGVAALLEACGGVDAPVTATTIGYVLAPRINAAGRMGQVELATELFLTNDVEKAKELAMALCALNRHRQEVEAEIYRDAAQMLRNQTVPGAIVLAGETWHQGVVGIVASRLAEEYGCPTFLVCLDGDKGKGSSRSYGRFNLFGALQQLSPLLEGYGGHELAAGFTIRRDQIDTFRTQISRLANAFAASGQQRTALEIDCAAEPELLTEENVTALDCLEPCGAGCPKPIMYMSGATVEQLAEVGGGKHLRLRLSKNGCQFGCIFFSATAARCGIAEGDRVEVAFTPQINEFRGVRSVQLNLVDIRRQQLPAWHSYERYMSGSTISTKQAAGLLPLRSEFAALWRYLIAEPEMLKRCPSAQAIADRLGGTWEPARVKICLDVLRERGLLRYSDAGGRLRIVLLPSENKVDLEQSPLMIKLRKQKGEI